MKTLTGWPAVSLVLIVLLLLAPARPADSQEPGVAIQYTLKAPIIDGRMDAIWSEGEQMMMEHYLCSDGQDKSDLSASFITLWDDNLFYCFVTVKDQKLINIPELNPWENDGMEIYFDGDNSKNDGWYDGNDDQLRFELWQSPTSYPGNISTYNIVYAYKTTKSGYNVEFSIPFSNLHFEPENGYELGLEFQINDNDNGSGRDDILKWWSTNDDTWWNPSFFGTAVFIGKPEEIEKLPVQYTNRAPVIDGKMDATWSKGQEMKMDIFPWRDDAPDESDLSAAFVTLWDDARFYCFVMVNDQTLINIPELPYWENDGVNAYFDGDNSKNDGWYDGNDDQITFELGEPPISGDGHIIVANISYAYKTTQSGYNLEFSIPFDDLQFEPENWYEFGFDIEINDNDNGMGRDDILRWWYSGEGWWNPSFWGTAFLTGKSGALGKDLASSDLAKPVDLKLLPNYPNPFNPTTSIHYQLPKDAVVAIDIYNMQGQQIRSLVDAPVSAGVHSVEWDGRDDLGTEVATGIYICRLQAGDQMMIQKLTLIR